MADWYYSQKGLQKGPVSEDQLRQMIQSGQVQAADLVWTQGMPNWVPANQVASLAPPPALPGAPPPPPVPGGPHAGPSPLIPPDFAKLKQDPMRLGHAIALAVLVISTLLPWYTVRVSLDGLFGASGPARGGGSMIGVRSVWGTFDLLLGLGGLFVALFLAPQALFRGNARYIMPIFGGLAAFFTLMFIMQSGTGMSMMGVSAGVSVGAYLALLAGIAAAGLGYFADWNRSIAK